MEALGVVYFEIKKDLLRLGINRVLDGPRTIV